MTTTDMLRDVKALRAARARYAVWAITLERCSVELADVGLDDLACELNGFAALLRKASAGEAENPEPRT